MTLTEQIDATIFLKPGWNGDKKFPAQAVSNGTRQLAKLLIRCLGNHWKASPWPDGSIVLSNDNKKIMVAKINK